MRLTDRTIEVLDAFSHYNNDRLYLKKGKYIYAYSPKKGMFAMHTIGEDVPKDFAINGLKAFLRTYKMYKDMTIDFSNDGYIRFLKGKVSLRFNEYEAKSLIDLPVDLSKSLASINKRCKGDDSNDWDMEFCLSMEQVRMIKEFCSLSDKPEFSLLLDEGVISCDVHMIRGLENYDPSSVSTMKLGTSSLSFTWHPLDISIDVLDLIPLSSYTIKVFFDSDKRNPVNHDPHNRYITPAEIYFIDTTNDDLIVAVSGSVTR